MKMFSSVEGLQYCKIPMIHRSRQCSWVWHKSNLLSTAFTLNYPLFAACFYLQHNEYTKFKYSKTNDVNQPKCIDIALGRGYMIFWVSWVENHE